MKAARPAATLALVVGLAGCLVPPFNLDLTRAYQTASRMKEVADIGPVSFWMGSGAGGEITYLPSRTLFAGETPGAEVTHGLLLASGDYGPRAWYLDEDPMGKPVVYGDRQFFIDSTDSNRYNWQIFMVKATAGPPDFFIVQDQSTGALNRIQYNRYADLQLNPDPPVSWASVVTPMGSLAGFSYLTATDEASFLDNDAGNYYDRRARVDETGWTDIGGRGPVTLPGAPGNGFYQHDGMSVSGRSIFSWWTGARYVTYKWDIALVPTLLPIKARVDVLLSTGELYQRGDGSDTVYDWSGNAEAQVPGGKPAPGRGALRRRRGHALLHARLLGKQQRRRGQPDARQGLHDPHRGSRRARLTGSPGASYCAETRVRSSSMSCFNASSPAPRRASASRNASFAARPRFPESSYTRSTISCTAFSLPAPSSAVR